MTLLSAKGACSIGVVIPAAGRSSSMSKQEGYGCWGLTMR
jgi:hypothetical protein